HPMNPHSRSGRCLLMVLSLLALGSRADAADMPVKAPPIQPGFDWTGFYAGGHLGYARGHANGSFADPVPATSSNSFGSLFGGFAWSQARFIESPGVTADEDKVLRTRGGWVLGAGAEVAIAPDWSARLEYLYDNLGKAAATLPSGIRSDSTFNAHTLRLGLNW